MNVETPKRGQHLLDARKRFATGGGFFARLFAPGFHHILDRIDAGMDHGTFEGKLPDGTTRILGGRGEGPMAEINLHSWNALLRLINGGSVGWYRAWELGEWDSPDLVSVFDLFTRNRKGLKSTGRASGFFNWVVKRRHQKRDNDKRRARQNIQYHYDLGNDFYQLWLDESMSYSSAIFADPADSLEHAQRNKIDAIAQRLATKTGNSVLEIGCGWGSLSGSLARDHGLEVTGISLSDEQTAWARDHHPEAQFLIQDYRDVEGQFDAIASVEMVEAVGQQYWPDFLDCIARNLKPGGRAALQYICIADDIFEQPVPTSSRLIFFPVACCCRRVAFARWPKPGACNGPIRKTSASTMRRRSKSGASALTRRSIAGTCRPVLTSISSGCGAIISHIARAGFVVAASMSLR